jgi:hypothetical protein
MWLEEASSCLPNSLFTILRYHDHHIWGRKIIDSDVQCSGSRVPSTRNPSVLMGLNLSFLSRHCAKTGFLSLLKECHGFSPTRRMLGVSLSIVAILPLAGQEHPRFPFLEPQSFGVFLLEKTGGHPQVDAIFWCLQPAHHNGFLGAVMRLAHVHRDEENLCYFYGLR